MRDSHESIYPSLPAPMREELVQRLQSAAPRFFRPIETPHDLVEKSACHHDALPLARLGSIDEWGIECGDGWFALVEQVCVCAESAIAGFEASDVHPGIWPRLTQVKEKLGAIRIYYSGLRALKLDALIRQVEELSKTTPQ